MSSRVLSSGVGGVPSMSIGSGGEDDVQVSDGFTDVQFLFRTLLMPVTYLFGIIANIINITIFCHKQMRAQSVNWFFLVLAVSDLVVLISSFFVFSAPVYAEMSHSGRWTGLSAQMIVWFYPLAQTGLTTSVYLTILVSVHRYLAVCHPFLTRRIGSAAVVRSAIFMAIVFAFTFCSPRWFELWTIPCFSKTYNEPSRLVAPTEFMLNSWYTLMYRNAAYTVVIFLIPFITLTIVNFRIVSTLRNSNQLRREMTLGAESRKKMKRISCGDLSSASNGVVATSSPRVSSSKLTPLTSPLKPPRLIKCNPTLTNLDKTRDSICPHNFPQVTVNTSERGRDSSISIMLVAMVSQFLAFNLLAFANNIIELTGHFGNSPLETILVEVAALLVNVNGATTMIIYLVFGSKYRAIFLKNVRNAWVRLCDGPRSEPVPTETTMLILSNNDNSTAVEKRRNFGQSRTRSLLTAEGGGPTGRKNRAYSQCNFQIPIHSTKSKTANPT